MRCRERDQPRSARAARVLRVPDVPVVDVSVEVEPLMLEPDVVESVLVVLGVVGVVVVVVVVLALGRVLLPVVPEVLPVVPDVPEVVPELEVDVSVVVVPLVVPVVVPGVAAVPEVLVPAPKFELFVVAGVPVPDGVGVPGDCEVWFGPWPDVAEVPEVPVPDDWACDTPIAATMEATAAAMVKLFGSLLMRDLLLQGETEVAMGCPLQRSAVSCRRAKSFGRGVPGKPRASDTGTEPHGQPRASGEPKNGWQPMAACAFVLRTGAFACGEIGPRPPQETRMEALPQDVWIERCARRIAEVETGIAADEARRIARDLRAFERTAAMPPEAAVEFVAREMARPDRDRFERRASPR